MQGDAVRCVPFIIGGVMITINFHCDSFKKIFCKFFFKNFKLYFESHTR